MSNTNDEEKRSFVFALRIAYTILAVATTGMIVISSAGVLESSFAIAIGVTIVITAIVIMVIVNSALNPDSLLSVDLDRKKSRR